MESSQLVQQLMLGFSDIVKSIGQLPNELALLKEHNERLRAENTALVNGLQHYDRKQTAAILGFSLSQLDEWVEKGRLIPVCFNLEAKNPRLRFTFSEIKRFSDHHRITVADESFVLPKGRTRRKR